ncbi:MAG: hypothetical protein ABL994_05375 [Verrucomicrobiales bacterium]
MKLIYQRYSSLPQLAWCARFRSGEPFVEVEHGSAVETRGDYFFEGAWSGGFSAAEYLAAPVVVGTGGALSGNGVHFIPGSDRISPLFSIAGRSGIHISNSPIFAMASAGEHLDGMYPFYFQDFLRTWRMGLHSPAGRLRLASGKHLKVHFFTHLIVDERGRISYRAHSAGAKPENFHSYDSILMNGVKAVFANARDENRTRTLVPWAAISKGYDSTATACLAARAGCKEAYTFIDRRLDDRDIDSGRANAAILGMECREYDRWAYQKMPDVQDSECAMIPVAALTPMAALEDKLQGKLMITANYGDIIWGLVESGCCEKLTLPWSRFLSGVGQLEFRLRTGYHVMDGSCIGARHNQEIHRITYSAEMKPWWVEGSYNRPIPRRIAEEAGLSRGQFGVFKYASCHSSYGHVGGFRAESHQDYLDFVRSRDVACGAFSRIYWMARDKIQRALWKWFSSDRRIYQQVAWWRRYLPYLLNTTPKDIRWIYRFTFQWSEKRLGARYAGKPRDKT